jgi:hypothetical protein
VLHSLGFFQIAERLSDRRRQEEDIGNHPSDHTETGVQIRVHRALLRQEIFAGNANRYDFAERTETGFRQILVRYPSVYSYRRTFAKLASPSAPCEVLMPYRSWPEHSLQTSVLAYCNCTTSIGLTRSALNTA